MKKILILIMLYNVQAYSQNSKYTKNVQSIDVVIETLYAVISGDKGVERDWDLFTYLFHENAKLIPMTINEKGKSNIQFLSPKEYIDNSGKWLFENGFHEKEIGRTTEQFGNIAHVFSSYESFRTKYEKKPFSRGINSIQLHFDGDRWWILNVYWMAENNKNIIQDKYLF
ncbi:MAG: hypothetical protein O3C01_01975 [Bacteroidetes bacterium]|jgi:hypothetical protein|nr:hypothetical protein [Bacteroidota bacterium]MDA1019852.1 hypothetical protein [Bacteroidota bacterium]|tara:strand:- start:3100 stop:3609 length:510 start_codon:yes stop_codon:yes gene_type:complete